ncbi:MAG: FHA domain-containing protein [Deltaproteobacteria bacterium]|nr:FHA domain-containing protein [Deltaproteobacteria bacterium]
MDLSVDEYGLVSLDLNHMTRELARIRDENWREKYTFAFLILMQGPPTEDAWMDLKTGEASSPDLLNLKKLAHHRAMPLVNSDRNAFDSKIMVGRARNNDIILRAPKISKLHAVFVPGDEGDYRLTDMGSRNGTIVNGRRLKRKEQAKLQSGDIISFWRFMFMYVTRDAMLDRLKEIK